MIADYRQALKVFNGMPESREKWEAAYPELQEKVDALPRTVEIQKMLDRDGWL
jgi:hypothetical protein